MGEVINIGDGITVAVRSISGNRVKLAVDAPRDVRILRGELEDRCTTTTPTPSIQMKARTSTEASQTNNTTASSTPAGAAD
jgi:carbon storage regulator CsrA